MKRLFEVKDLTVEFRQKSGSLIAVNHISYHLDKGEIVAFVGESGSGKSGYTIYRFAISALPSWSYNFW